MFNPAALPMDNNIQFDLRELIRAAEMSGINPQQIPGDANPWTWEDSRAMSWRSNFRALNPAVAQQAEMLLGGPLSLALQAAMDAGETLSVDLDRELKIRRPALHEQLRQESIQRAIDQMADTARRKPNAGLPTPQRPHSWRNSCASRSKKPSTPSRAVYRCRCKSVMTFEEAYNRLVAGWHVDLPEPGPMCSAQRKRYLRLERERCDALAIDTKFEKEQ